MNRQIPRLLFSLALAMLTTAGTLYRARAAEIAVVTTIDASSVERIAAQDLAAVLQRIYPQDRFAGAADLPATGKAILIGCATSAAVRRHLAESSWPDAPESYVVRRATDGPRDIGIIAGADPRGTAYGVYALLEKLGCSLNLSGDALPPARDTAFGFDGWQMANRPLTPVRLVFNWHNFLSGCSTWNLPDWQQWTAQSLKMGYNAIMVHAYGNNPIASFTFDGVAKPVGYLSTTIKGRDWSTMHVDDVRQLFGGDVFDGPVFGADAGLAPDADRVAAAQSLMRAVFADAAHHAMGVYFAVDVDTPSANPQELVLRLPESARFQVNGAADESGGSPRRIWVPNPDTPEGHAYFRAQVEGLVKTYPQITQLVVWFRRGGTPWMDLKSTDLPAAWQNEFAAEIERTPEAGNYWHAAGLFAVGKIVRAFDRALKECDARGVGLAAGTWGYEFLQGADRFFPTSIPLLGLDYDVLREKPQLGDAASRALLREIGVRRPVIPIVWAHHDDGHYIGRPYTPLRDFASKLDDARAGGFGIIHWVTRPLDLYFSSLAKQVWSGTKDQPLRESCRDLAASWFGTENRGIMGDYLESWITGAPQFGRETSDFFIDRRFTNIAKVITACRARLTMIDAARTSGLTSEQCKRLAYYRGLEEFIASFFEAEARFQDSQDLLFRGDREGARRALADFQPGAVIERFARLSAIGGITRGEQGLVVTMNTRWLSHIVRYRQALGLEPVRINFAPTSHDLLAQSRGIFTYHFDPEHALWECWGALETGAEVFVLPAEAKITLEDLPAAWKEIGRTGIMTSRPLTLVLRPIMAEIMGEDLCRKAMRMPLSAGDYRLRLVLLEPEAAAPTQRVFEVAVRVASPNPDADFTPLEQVDIVKLAGGPRRLIERVYPVRLEVGSAGWIELRLTPIQGKALLCGVVVEPAASP